MSRTSHPGEPGPGRVRTDSKGPGAKDDGHENRSRVTLEDEEPPTTAQLPPSKYDPSMDALSGSGYILSVVIVLLVGTLLAVLATASHHLHHRGLPQLPVSPILHHHYLDHQEDPPPSRQNHLLLQNHHHHHQRHSATPMLSVSAGMEVGSGGHHGGLGGGGLQGGPAGEDVGNDGVREAMAARDRAVRVGSVRQDLALDLPPRLQLPDGEEQPYGAHTALHLRDPEQESEIYQKCVRPPPNRTVFDSESPPPYRSQSALLDAPDRIVRCHSAGSSILRVFKKFPSSGSTTPTVIVPRRSTLSSYSESSGNLSNLSSLTVVPCEADENNQHV